MLLKKKIEELMVKAFVQAKKQDVNGAISEAKKAYDKLDSVHGVVKLGEPWKQAHGLYQECYPIITQGLESEKDLVKFKKEVHYHL